jgi:hypothetical protein
LGTDTHMGRAPCEDGGRGQGDAFYKPRMPKVARDLQEPGRGAGVGGQTSPSGLPKELGPLIP